MFELLGDLSESKSFRCQKSLDKIEEQRSRDLLFAHVCILMCLIQEEDTKDNAQRYMSKAIAFGNFDFFRSSGNDLYMLAYNEKENKYFDEKGLIRFVQSVIMGNYNFIYTYLNKLQTSLGVKNSTFTRFKRYAGYWDRISEREKRRALEMVLIDIRKDMPMSELYHMIRR